MTIKINDRECNANTGDRLLDVARSSHSHIGYFCGGNALCQTCYVKVLEGAELLSPMTHAEKAMLSDTLIREGTRMACQATIEKPGRISLLTTVEEAKRMTLATPGELPAYMGKMGWEAAVKFTDTIAFQAKRDSEGYQVGLWQLLNDVIAGIGDAIGLVIDAVQTVFVTGAETPAAKCTSNGKAPAVEPSKARCCATAETSKVSPEVLLLHEEREVPCN